jgi:hypothetical protein
MKVPAVECTIPDTYKIRNDLTMNFSHGASQNYKTGYPQFPKSTTPRWFNTVMCNFQHSTLPFLTYDNTPNNKLKALKRIIGQREGEAILHTNQFQILADMCTSLDPKILAQMNCNLTTEFVEETRQISYANGPFPGPFHKYKTENVTELKLNITGVAVPFYGVETKFKAKQSSTSKVVADYLLWRNSRSLVAKVKDITLNSFLWSYQEVFDSFTTLYDGISARFICAEIKHVKKELRKHYVNGVLVQDPTDKLVNRMVANVKRELAKCGKVPRLFVDYAAGSMCNNEVPEFVKVCLHGHHNSTVGLTLPKALIDYDIFVVAKPFDNFMDYCFSLVQKALNTPNFVQFLIYSDDSVMCGNYGGKPFIYNMDISSCDSGNRQAVFGLTCSLISNFSPQAAENLLGQCMETIYVSDPNSAAKIKIKLETPFEGSGTVLTTILNHTASFMICSSIIEHFHEFEDLDEMVAFSAKLVGHIVTLETCTFIESCQFLKHSPVRMVDGTLGSMQNLGCIFRSLGSVEGELTPVQLGLDSVDGKKLFDSLTWEDKMNWFCGSVIAGMVHEPGNIIMDALRARFPPKSAYKYIKIQLILNYV